MDFDRKWKHYLPTEKQKSFIPALLCALIVLGLFCFFRILSPFVYQTNDDLFLRMIASGEVSGEPESHLHFISYPAGLFLSLLYRLFPSLPWYGLFLCFTFLLTEFLVLSTLLRREKSLPARVIIVFLFSMISCSFLFPHIASLQFTTSAGLTAAGSLFLFSVASSSSSLEETLKNHTGFFLLSACTFCIRDQVLFMCFPFIGMIWIGKYWNARKLPDISQSDTSHFSFLCKNGQQKSLLGLASLFLTMILFFLLIEKLAYQDSEWLSFRAYSSARASIYDYEGYPDYDTHQKTYQELGISRSSYEGASRRYSLILDPALNLHSMETLEELSAQERLASAGSFREKAAEMIAFFLERHRSDADKPLNLLVYRCYLLFVFCTLFSGKRSALRDIFFLFSARMVIWTYLVYRGRLPIRVSQTVYLAEMAVLFAVVFRYRLWEARSEEDRCFTPRRQKLCRGIWGLSVLLILFTCLRSGIPHALETAKESAARLQFSESFVHMKDYFSAHPDAFYYLDTNSFSYFTEDALQTAPRGESNYLMMGGWAAKSPWYEKALKKRGIADPAAALCEDPSVYAVFMDTEETGYDYLENFYSENYPGVQLKVVETVDAGNGISFLILKGYPKETS